MTGQEVRAVTGCGLCEFKRPEDRHPAKVVATVPMCGERPRYPLCHDCLTDIEDYVENVEVIGNG